MGDLRICFEVQGLARDENGEPCAAGVQVSFEGIMARDDISSEELAEKLNVPALLEYVCLSEVVKPEDVRIISPEEYDEKYAE